MMEFTDALKTVYKARKNGKLLSAAQTEGDNSPLFVIPGLMAYRTLASYLQKNQPFYCFEILPNSSVEESAARYIKEMKEIQPAGPYYLGGYCDFGLIALEMAHQLISQGEQVSGLILFELHTPDEVLSKISPRYWAGKFRLYYQLLRKLPFRKVFPFVFAEANRIWKKASKLDKEYKAKFKPYPGNVILFRASIQDTYYYRNDPLMGWSGYFSGEVKVYEIAGAHDKLLHEPGVGQIAAILNRVLH